MRYLALLLLLAFPQERPKPKMPDFHTFPANIIFEVAEVPETKLEAAWTSITGKLVWKHVHRTFVLNDIGNKNPICWIENMTHPLPYNVQYDPKNVELTRSSIDFDAVAGDSIAYKVGYR